MTRLAFALALAMLALFIAPIFTIWSLNALLDLQIPITPNTWASALWLGALVYGAGNQRKS